ncbi:MAG: orotidine-5'-phosphate decarboxylase [Patescibacteria group bacterium]|nr:orotidine-5'-phosphate decarboxylase [Patescibacteria group bacterium]
MDPKDKIIVALDVNNLDTARALVEQLVPHVGCFKIGLEFINSVVSSIVFPRDEEEALENLQKIRDLFQSLEGKIFWDGKFADIPNTVGGATKVVIGMNVKMFNVHALAGKKSIEAAVTWSNGKSIVLGVTILTSIDELECVDIFHENSGPKVLQLSRMLLAAGANGIICSPKELALLGEHEELNGLLKVTPGVRPEWAVVGDQKRVMTPAEAIKAGADYLVIGRPITNPPEQIGTPVEAVKRIIDEIAVVM